MFYLGVLKFGYDDTDGIWVENVRPQRLLVPPHNNEDYIIEYHEDTAKELKRRFPKKEAAIDKLIVLRGRRNKLKTALG